MNPLEKQMLKQMIFWTVLGIGISYGINFVLFSFLGDAAFPWNLIVILAVFLLVGRWLIKKQLRKSGFGLSGFGQDKTSLSYECRSCYTSYKGNKCPKCGSTGGRAVFRDG
jgi:hypothetical protein